MKTSPNRLYVFSSVFESPSVAIPTTQLIDVPLQLEHITIRSSSNFDFQVQIFAMQFAPVVGADALEFGHPLIEWESQQRFISGTQFVTELFTRKIFLINPLFLVCHITCTNDSGGFCEVTIEGHEYRTKAIDDPETLEEEEAMKLINPIKDTLPLPKKFKSRKEVFDWFLKNYDIIYNAALFDPKQAADIMKDRIGIIIASDEVDEEWTIEELWSALLKAFQGTIFACFFTPKFKAFIQENILGE